MSEDASTVQHQISRRGFLAAGGAVSAGLLLAACSGNSGGSNSAPTGTGAAATPTVEKGSTITLWDAAYMAGQPSYDKAAKATDAAFKKKYGVTVNRQAQPQAQLDNILQAAFTAHSGPDVMFLYGSAQGVLRYQPGLMNLTSAAAGLRSQLKFWDGVSPQHTENGPAYGIPFQTVGIVAYYNKKMFQAAGLNPEQTPKTFTDLMEIVSKLKAKGIVPFASGNKEGDENQWWFSFLWAGTNSLQDSIELAARKIPMTDDRITNVLNSYQMLQNAGAFSPTRFSTPLSPDGINSFSQGKGAMFLGLSSQVADWSTFDAALGVNNVGYFQPPGVGRPTPATLPVTMNLAACVPTFAKNPGAAVAFAQYCGSTEAQQIQWDDGKLFPNNVNVKLTGAAPQVTGMFKDYSTHPVYTDAHSLLPDTVLAQYSTLCNEWLQGRLSMKSMISQMQATFEQAH